MSLEVRLSHRAGAFALEAAFEVPPGVIALFGPSGAGKTSVVNAVAGLLRPRSGRVAMDGTVLLDTERCVFAPLHRSRIGYVFQDWRQFPQLSVRQNLLYRRRMRGAGGGEAALARVFEFPGAGGLLSRRPGALSGDERSRVALGRALLSEPQLLLMDEPLAALDAAR